MTSTENTPDSPAATDDQDQFLWLEEIYGEKPLEWVKAQDAKVEAEFFDADFRAIESEILTALDSEDKIPMVTKTGDYYYNFWRDAKNPKGLWRRTTWDSYVSDNTEWEILLDVDQLAKEEDTPWVFAGATIRRPGFRRALVIMSPDGGDAHAVREFDLETKQFVTDNGFDLPVSKGWGGWLDDNTLLWATDFGPGTMTTSSYPRTGRILRRGQALEQAELVFEVPEDHVLASVGTDQSPGFERSMATDMIDFFNSTTYLMLPGSTEWTKIDTPTDVNVDLDREHLFFRPQTDWNAPFGLVPAGGLAVVNLKDYLAGQATPQLIFEPTANTSLQGWTVTRDYILLQLLTDVQSEIRVLDVANNFAASTLEGVPANHDVSVSALDPDDDATANDYWMTITGFLTPTTLLRGTVGEEPQEVKHSPSYFNEDDFQVEQFFATSKDGTHVPYFQVSPKNMEYDGDNHVMLDGYGGFEISRLPAYAPTIGIGWLTPRAANERQGVYVVANIRGGGEYGPQWHHAAMKEKRHKAYEDFSAVGEDLVRRGVTRPERLGCAGGSNGGLLVGNMLTQYPELFGAVSCGVPLLDMKRYVKLSAGTSWIAEYGDPDDPAQWDFIQTFSPYHLLRTGVKYPEVLFWTATSDDRVGPVQARKMAAKMQDMGVEDVWFYEDMEGGHSAASDNRQAAKTRALSYRFLFKALTD